MFPVDFSTYARDWSWLVRTLLILGIVGGAIAVIVDLVRLAHGPSGRG